MILLRLFCLLRHKQYCSACVAVRQLLDKARNQLGTAGGAKSFLRGAQIF